MRDQNHHNRLELLAPAKNLAYGIGPSTTAPTPSTWAARLRCPQRSGQQPRGHRGAGRHAHRFGAQVFVAFNTLLHDHELEQARRLTHQIYEAGPMR